MIIRLAPQLNAKHAGLVILYAIVMVFMAQPVCAVSSKYKSIIERDPFDPKRGQDKTAVQGGAVSSEAGELEEKYSVYGIIVAGGNKSAFIKPAKTEKRGKPPELRKVTVGDLVDGWTVKDITDRGLLLVNGGDKVLLRVFGHKKERKVNSPVGIATPKPVPFRPTVAPADQERLKAALERSKHPRPKPGFITPKNGNNQTAVNPFLKALQRQKERKKAQLKEGRP